MKTVILYLCFFVPSLAFADVYKCLVDGHVDYGSVPCRSVSLPYNALRVTSGNGSGFSHVVTVLRGANGAYNLHGSVNGQPVTFLVDSGASSTTLSGAAAVRTGIKTCDAGRIISTANGLANSCTAVVSSLNFGGFSVSNFRLTISPNMVQEGLLGNDLMSQLKVNQQGGVMLISKP